MNKIAKLADHPGYAEAQGRLVELQRERNEYLSRIDELKDELSQHPNASESDVEVAKLLSGGAATAIANVSEMRAELQAKRKRLEVLERAVRKQQSILDSEKATAGQAIRQNRKGEHKKLVAKLNTAFQSVEAAVAAEARFLHELSNDISNNEGLPVACRLAGSPSPEPCRAFEPILNWRNQVKRLGLLD